MKKTISILLTLTLAASMVACSSSSAPASSDTANAASSASNMTPAGTEENTASSSQEASATPVEQTELIVFAAASMTETLNKIAEEYKKVSPEVTLTFNFDSSGTLKTQIQEGADCDIFISAVQKQMNQLDKSASAENNPDGLDFIAEGTRINLLENKVVLCTPEGNPKELASFDDLADKLKAGDVFMAMGNSDVPVGQYTQKILAYYELNEEDLAKAGSVTYGTNVKEVTTQVSEGSVDCGIVYCTDAFSAGLEPVAYATPEMCGQVIYPAAVLNVSTSPEAAQKFLDYLQTADAMSIFESVGFTPAE